MLILVARIEERIYHLRREVVEAEYPSLVP